MANIKAAKKSLRSDTKKRLFNLKRNRRMKEAVKTVKDLVLHKNKDGANAELSKAYKAIDKAAKRGVIKKNTASRKKSRLAQSIKKI